MVEFQSINGVDLQISYHQVSNLPMLFDVTTDPRTLMVTHLMADRIAVSMMDEVNQNLATAQKKLLHVHQVYGRTNMQWIQTLMRYQKYK